MPHLKDFTVYIDKLTSGDLITNNKTFIDDKGSRETDYLSIYNVYNKPPEDPTRILVGQYTTDVQVISINSKDNINTKYWIMSFTFFFESGSINIQTTRYNFKQGETTNGTIKYGTGKYLGAEGFITIENQDYVPNACKTTSLWTSSSTFVFTN